MLYKSKGFTLIEVMIVLVIIGIGVSLAVPSWISIVQKRNVTSAAEEIASFLIFAQGQSIKSNEEVTVTVTRSNDGTSWCVGAIDGTSKIANSLDHCDCTAADECMLDGQLTILNSTGMDSVLMINSVVHGTSSLDFNFNFDPVRGLKINDLGILDTNRYSVAMESVGNKHKLRVHMQVTGRVKICNPNTAKSVPGFHACGGDG